jgi:hypothetical protein
MACDAVIAAKPRLKATAAAASSFMGISFLFQIAARRRASATNKHCRLVILHQPDSDFV